MKKLTILIITIIWSIVSINAQTLSVFDVDPSEFPKIKAKIFAFDKNGEQIEDLSQVKIKIFEDGEERSGVKITCPPP